MAGSLDHLAHELGASSFRLRTNIDSLVEKYNRSFVNDDLISLSSMSIHTASAKGTLRKISGSHTFGTSNLKTTKRKEQLLNRRLGLDENKVNLNVSRAIERECRIALADLDSAKVDEPSDAETLSSVDEDDYQYEEEGDDSFSLDDLKSSKEVIVISSNSSVDTDDDENTDLSFHKDLSLKDEISDKVERKLHSSHISECEDICKNAMFEPDEDLSYSKSHEDNAGDEVDGNIEYLSDTYDMPTENRVKHAGDLTFVVNPQGVGTKDQRKWNQTCVKIDKISKGTAGDGRNESAKTNIQLDSSFVSISSPRPKGKDNKQRREAMTKVTLLSFPVHSESNQTFVTDKPKISPTKNTVKSDNVFKVPQARKLKRVAPVCIGPISSVSPLSSSPKLSPYSSGFSSWNSPFNSRDQLSCVNAPTSYANTTPHSENIYVGTDNWRVPLLDKQGRGDQNLPSGRILSQQSKKCWPYGKTKPGRVGQWVDMVSSGNSLSLKPLQYPSCPSKVPSQSPHLQPPLVRSSPQQHFSQQTPSLNQREIGIQANLDSSFVSSKISYHPKQMKDVSTALSASFLDAHSPKPNQSNVCENAFSGKAIVFNNDRNTMFPEEYIYRFSPSNPHRIDSYELSNSHQNDRKMMFPEKYIYRFSPSNPDRINCDEVSNSHQNRCFKHSFKKFHPRRNEKRPYLSEIQHDVLSPVRPTKKRKMHNNFDSSLDYLEHQNQSFACLNSSLSGALDDSFVTVTSSKTLRKHKDWSCLNVIEIGQRGTVFNNKNQSQVSAKDLISTENCSRCCGLRPFKAGVPLPVCKCNDNGCANGFVNSSVSESGGVPNFMNELDDCIVSPRLGVFLDEDRIPSISEKAMCDLGSQGKRSYSQFSAEKSCCSANSPGADFHEKIVSKGRQAGLSSFPLTWTKLQTTSGCISPKPLTVVSSSSYDFDHQESNPTVSPRGGVRKCVNKIGRVHSNYLGASEIKNSKTLFGEEEDIVPCVSSNNFKIQCDSGRDTSCSSSFLDAHTAKPKVTEEDVVHINCFDEEDVSNSKKIPAQKDSSSYLKGNSTEMRSKFSKRNAFESETKCSIPSINETEQRSCWHANSQQQIGVVNANNTPEPGASLKGSSKDKTEDYILDVSFNKDFSIVNSVINNSNQHEKERNDLNLLDISISTIHGSDSDSEVGDEFDLNLCDERNRSPCSSSKKLGDGKKRTSLSDVRSSLFSLKLASPEQKESQRNFRTPKKNKDCALLPSGDGHSSGPDRYHIGKESSHFKYPSGFGIEVDSRRHKSSSSNDLSSYKSAVHLKRHILLNSTMLSSHHDKKISSTEKHMQLKEQRIDSQKFFPKTVKNDQFYTQNMHSPVKNLYSVTHGYLRNEYRASTPMLQNARASHGSNNDLPIFSPQGEECDGCYSEEEWNSMLIEDVDTV